MYVYSRYSRYSRKGALRFIQLVRNIFVIQQLLLTTPFNSRPPLHRRPRLALLVALLLLSLTQLTNEVALVSASGFPMRLLPTPIGSNHLCSIIAGRRGFHSACRAQNPFLVSACSLTDTLEHVIILL